MELLESLKALNKKTCVAVHIIYVLYSVHSSFTPLCGWNIYIIGD